MLETVPLDFVKIDGAIVQALTGDTQLQQRVRTLVEARDEKQSDHRERRGRQIRWPSLADRRANSSQGYFVTSPTGVLRADRI